MLIGLPVRRRIAAAMLWAPAVSTILILAGSRPVLAYSQQPTDWSFYVRTTATDQFQQLGYNQGQFDATYHHDSLVVLDYGVQRSSNDGTWLTNINAFMPYATIVSEAENFALGYWNGTGVGDTTTVLTLAIGTSNDATYLSSTFGSSWNSQVVQPISSWVSGRGIASQISIAGDSDLEDDFVSGTASYSATHAWLGGFGSTFTLEDTGDAGGCPPYGSCLNGYNQFDMWYLSWGNPASSPVPEIYNSATASEWENIALYSSQSQGSKMYFDAPLDEGELDGTFNNAQAWSALDGQLNGNPTTAQHMPYSCELHVIST